MMLEQNKSILNRRVLVLALIFCIAMIGIFNLHSVAIAEDNEEVDTAICQLPENGEYGNVHFIPVYYPDGDYVVEVKQDDMWTPIGSLTSTTNSASLSIDGSSYDDWTIDHH